MSINSYRRKLTQFLTGWIGKKKHKSHSPSGKTNSQIKRVLICRPNHRLGNTLLITPLVQEVHETFPNCKIDLFLKGGVGHIIFKNYDYVDQIITLPKKHFKEFGQYIKGWLNLRKNRYDLVVNVDKGSSSGRLSANFAKSEDAIFGDQDPESLNKISGFEHIAKYPVFSLRDNLHQLGFSTATGEPHNLDLMLSAEEKANGHSILAEVTGNSKPTICIFTFATGARCFSVSWWEEIYTGLKKNYPNYNIVEILPIENVSQINFAAPTYYSKDVREMAAFLANCTIFIGGDSGIMHLASSAQIPVVGLFQNDFLKYQPYGNNSRPINVGKTNHEECLAIIADVIKKSTPTPTA